MPAAASANHTHTHDPIIVDLGKRKRSAIEQLRKGEGSLVEEVTGCIDELKASGAISVEAQPVVLVIREKRKSKPLFWPSM
jgi:hypothetical protein